MASLIITRKGLIFTEELRRESVHLPHLTPAKRYQSEVKAKPTDINLPGIKKRSGSNKKVQYMYEKTIESREKLMSNIRAIAHRSSENDLLSLNCTLKEMVSESSQVYNNIHNSNRDERRRLRLRQHLERKYIPYWSKHEDFLRKNKSKVSLSFV
jgi:hypothetical protein